MNGSRYKLQRNRVRRRKAFKQCLLLIAKYCQLQTQIATIYNRGLFSAARSVLTERTFVLQKEERVLTKDELDRMRSGSETRGGITFNINTSVGAIPDLRILKCLIKKELSK